MSGDRAIGLVLILGSMVLVGSAFVARPIGGWRPRRGLLPVAAAWVLIFAAMFAFAHWMDLRR